MSDLIVIGYPDEDTAAKAWDDLARLQHDFLVDLEDAAVIRRDRNGKLHVTTPDKFLEAMRPYGGTVLQTSLPHDAEQQLMKALHGDDPAAPTWQQPAPAGTTP